MDLDRIRELLAVVAESGVAELEIEEDDVKIVIRRSSPPIVTVQPTIPAAGYSVADVTGHVSPQAGAVPPPVAAAGPAADQADVVTPTDSLVDVRAPIVGTFYRAPSPDADAFVEVGDSVRAGEVVCIIEAMKLMNEIESEVSGVIRSIEVENAQAVEYDQVLFRVEPA
jgi:acetyl-CoA carboxylase biotin carboxyl carrier protein